MLVHGDQATIGFGAGSGTAFTGVNQGHFPDNFPFVRGIDDVVTCEDFHVPLFYNIHAITTLAFGENDIARLKINVFFIILKEFQGLHNRGNPHSEIGA